MSLSIIEKEEIVAEIKAIVDSSVSIVCVNYQGIKAVDMSILRAQARDNNIILKVIRNNLAKLALAQTKFESLTAILKGPVLIVSSTTSLSAGAKLLQAFGKEYGLLEVYGISLGGDLMAANVIDAVAKLPTHKEAVAQLLFVLNSPMVKLVGAMESVYVKLVRVLNAVASKK